MSPVLAETAIRIDRNVFSSPGEPVEIPPVRIGSQREREQIVKALYFQVEEVFIFPSISPIFVDNTSLDLLTILCNKSLIDKTQGDHQWSQPQGDMARRILRDVYQTTVNLQSIGEVASLEVLLGHDSVAINGETPQDLFDLMRHNTALHAFIGLPTPGFSKLLKAGRKSGQANLVFLAKESQRGEVEKREVLVLRETGERNYYVIKRGNLADPIPKPAFIAIQDKDLSLLTGTPIV